MKIWVAIFDEKGKKIEERELREYRVTGWEDAPKHKKLPRLEIAGGGLQSPLDICPWKLGGYNPKYKYVFFVRGERVKVLGRGKTLGNYIVVRGNETGEIVMFVHVNGHDRWSKNKIIEQGEAICKIAPRSENGGHPEHLHIDAHKDKKKTRDIVFYKVEVDPCEQKIKDLTTKITSLTSLIQKMEIDARLSEERLKNQEKRASEVEASLNEKIKDLEKVNARLRAKEGIVTDRLTDEQIKKEAEKRELDSLKRRFSTWLKEMFPLVR